MIKNFFIKKFKFNIKTDIHSHLLPGIDDGSKNLNESIFLINKFKMLGYENLIITPHVMSEGYNNSTELILEKYNELKKNVNFMDLYVSSEYNMDEEFAKRIKNKDLIPIKNKYILFETSYYTKPTIFEDLIFEIQSFGLIPIFAHPERYRYLQDDFNKYKTIKELGVMFQCNINSFGGYYGKIAKKAVKFLAKEGMIDFLGSDAHSAKHLEFLKNVINSNELNIVFKNNKIKNDELI